MGLVRHRLSPPAYQPGTFWTIGNETGNVVLSRGVFAFDYFYYLFFEWFIENGWQTRKESNFRERLFLQRDTSYGAELWVFWRCRKPSKDKLFYYECDINMHVVGLQNTEVIVKGKKLKANKGEAEIKYWFRMVMDQDYVKHWTYQHFNKFILKRLLHQRFEQVRQDIVEESQRFHEALKTYFEIETYLEEPELRRFYSIRGVE